MSQRWISIAGISMALGLVAIWGFTGGNASEEQGKATSQLPAVQEAPEYIDASWADHKVWYDGNAEVNKYDASMVIYGQPRSFEYVYVFVKEDFTPKYRVKTSTYGSSDLYAVMKCNQFARVPTENYPYHFLTSVFTRWENPAQVHKITTATQEWCGNTFKEFLETPAGFDFLYHSYWDGQGDGKEEVERAWFEDQLAYTLRALRFKEGLSFQRQLYPTEKNSKARSPRAQQATFTVSEEDGAWKVEVATAQGRSYYWFEKEYPNKLLRLKSWYGLQLDLNKSERYPYWSYTPENMR